MFIPLNNLRGTLSGRAAKDPPQRVERRNEKVGRCKCVEIDGDGRYRRFRPGHQSVGDSRLRAMTPVSPARDDTGRAIPAPGRHDDLTDALNARH
jgi:hypothetical protein